MQLIAEVANYWQGDYKCLYQSMAIAAAADFDIFKVQLYDITAMGSEWEHKKDYYRTCQLDSGGLQEIGTTVRECGMELLVTVFQTHLLDMALRHTKNIKVASGQLDNMKDLLLEKARDIKKLYISTGMMDEDDMGKLYDFLAICKTREIHVMHCISLYPPVDTEINMSRIGEMKSFFEDLDHVHIGYSDHGMDNIPALMAAAKGISCLELHFKTRGMYGKTSQIAYDEENAEKSIAVMRRMEVMQGNGQLHGQPREGAVKEKYATRWINKPTIIIPEEGVLNLKTRR